jgi:hypothetical protein
VGLIAGLFPGIAALGISVLIRVSAALKIVSE